MKRYGHLFERIVTFENLHQAAITAFRGKKDKPRVALFYFHMETELLKLQEELVAGAYQPRAFRTFTILEPKQRKICAADFRDRVVHHAICRVLEPIFEKSLIAHSYACRKQKGTHAALRKAQHLTRQYSYYLKCDIRKYFDSVNHHLLKRLLQSKIKDQRLLDLLDIIIDQPISDGALGKGLPIGNLTSQHFANLYLGELDHYLTDYLRIEGYIRYMDDFLVFSKSKCLLHRYLGEINHLLDEKLRLQLKSEATILAPVSEGLPFLGFRVYPQLIRLQGKNLHRFKRNVRKRERQYLRYSIDVDLLSQSVSSMIAHVSHADTCQIRKAIFADSFGLG